MRFFFLNESMDQGTFPVGAASTGLPAGGRACGLSASRSRKLAGPFIAIVRPRGRGGRAVPCRVYSPLLVELLGAMR